MRKNRNFKSWKSVMLIVILLGLINPAIAQVDTAKAVISDTSNPMKADTAIAVQADTTKEKKKKKNEFIVYGGGNLSQLNISSDEIDATSSLGYHLGVAYKQGGFFYWQVGARYNNAEYSLNRTNLTDSVDDKLAIKAIDLPITVGINFLSAVNRLLAVRAFVSAVPSFTIGVGDNNLNFTKDKMNSFVFYGQAGIGVNIAFFLIEAGYNYGFQDQLKDYSSNPGQAFVSLGFRF